MKHVEFEGDRNWHHPIWKTVENRIETCIVKLLEDNGIPVMVVSICMETDYRNAETKTVYETPPQHINLEELLDEDDDEDDDDELSVDEYD